MRRGSPTRFKATDRPPRFRRFRASCSLGMSNRLMFRSPLILVSSSRTGPKFSTWSFHRSWVSSSPASPEPAHSRTGAAPSTARSPVRTRSACSRARALHAPKCELGGHGRPPSSKCSRSTTTSTTCPWETVARPAAALIATRRQRLASASGKHQPRQHDGPHSGTLRGRNRNRTCDLHRVIVATIAGWSANYQLDRS
jgi:hypothetical protein